MKNLISSKITFLLIALSIVLIANLPISSAQIEIPKPETLPGPTAEEAEYSGGVRFLGGTVIPTIVNGLIAFTGVAALIYLIYSGIRFMTAYGNEEQITEARKGATWAVVGLIIAILGYSIVYIITRIELEKPIGPSPPPAGIIYYLENHDK